MFGKDAALEQLGFPCDKDMPCGLSDVRLGVAKFEIWGVEVRVGLEERRRIMASGFITLKMRKYLWRSTEIYFFTSIVQNDLFLDFDFLDLARFLYFEFLDLHQNNFQHH